VGNVGAEGEERGIEFCGSGSVAVHAPGLGVGEPRADGCAAKGEAGFHADGGEAVAIALEGAGFGGVVELVDAPGTVGGELLEGFGGESDRIRVVGVVGYEAERGSVIKGGDAPFFGILIGAFEAEAGEDCVGAELFFDGAEAVVADDDEVDLVAGLGGFDLLAEEADEAVDVLYGLKRFGGVGAVEVFLVVDVGEVDEKEIGLVRGDEEVRHGGAGVVVDVLGFEGVGGFFIGGEETLGADAAVEEEAFLGVGFAVLGEVVVDAGSDGYGPEDGGGGEAFVFGDGVEGGALDLLGVPVPGGVEFVLGVEHEVAEDAVLVWGDSGDEGGVAWVGDGGIDAEEAIGEGSAVGELVEVGGLEVSGGERGEGGSTEAVDGDDDDFFCGGVQGGGEEERGGQAEKACGSEHVGIKP